MLKCGNSPPREELLAPLLAPAMTGCPPISWPLLLPLLSDEGSGEKYTSLMRDPPMSRAMWLTYSASWLGKAMLGALLGATLGADGPAHGG